MTRSHSTSNEPNPSGLGLCGCGQKTTLAKQSDTVRGLVRGRPRPYIRGHQSVGKRKPGPLYIVDPVTGCWNWQRKITHGYGYITINRKAYRAHIHFWVERNGSVPDGLVLDHVVCQNRSCVNPDHLEPVTPAVNTQRGKLAKLSMSQAQDIRQLAASLSQKDIAKMFSVTPSNVSRIISGETWVDN